MCPATQSEPSPEWQRRALAVLVGDAVDYSRLMEADELGTHARMRALRAAVINPGVVSHRGAFVKNTGDGFLACFETGLDAVRCASAMQAALAAFEAGQPPERRIAFRMGIHLEQVIIDEADVFGGGVNIAARLQQQAPGGGVLISEAVRDAIARDPSHPVEEVGELHLKNITRLVRAYSLVTPGSARGGAFGRVIADAERAAPPTLAILPLRNLSFDAGLRYFADGVIEDLIVTLSGLHDVFVISRGSTLGFGSDAAAESVSARLGVRYVLGGSVLPGPDRLRLTFELTDASAGTVLWAERYECGRAELFRLQEHVVDRIVGSLAARIRTAEIGRVRRKHPDSFNAYDYLLQALGYLYRFDFASFSRARQLLQLAIETDPDYAAAYAYAANWHIFNVGQGWSADAEADGREAVRLARQASERDPLNSLAEAVYGHAQGMLFRDYDAGIEALDRAVATAPSSAWAWILSSGTYGFVGQSRSAIARAERAIRLSPIDQQEFYFFCLLAQNHYLAGEYEEAITWARRALRHNPRFCNAIRVAAASLAATGRQDEARKAAAHLMGVQPGFRVSAYARNCPFKDPNVVSTYTRLLSLAGMPD